MAGSCSEQGGNASYSIVSSQIDVLRSYGSNAYNQAMNAMKEMQTVFGDQFGPSDSGVGSGGSGSGNDTGIVDPDHTIEYIKPFPAPILDTALTLPELPPENLLEGLEDLDPLLNDLIDQLQQLLADIPEAPDVAIEDRFLLLLNQYYTSTTEQVRDILAGNATIAAMMAGFETTLEDWLNNQDSIGMPEDARNALIERAFATEDQQAGRAQDEAMNAWLARGFTLPGGPLEAGLWLVQQQSRDKKGALNRDILVETVKWERETRQLAMEMTAKYRQELQDYYLKRQELAKSIAGAWQEFEIKIKTALIEVYKARIEAWAAAAKAIGEMGNATGMVIKAKLDRLNAYLELYKIKLQTQVQLVDTDLKIFGSQVDLYKTEGQMENWRVAPLMQLEQLDLDTSKLKVDLRMKDRELEQQKLLRTAEITMNALHGIATVGAQLSGAAMGAINVGASMSSGYSEGNSSSCSTSYSYQY